ncbi:hypothetical protein [Dictyobacter arantiisoli]|uniref:Uncharacterized protein n=1 Tax=Dictyobacter arantiisoli TaxID=2014874 RepID=A0A5A5TJA2_9CHLR|nr:hypothetical protein [Dictyobacter arantiisoli]GCF11089.1 hypothetical protein KDI_46530 [Dictyobacter arantiisoli]
MSVKVKKGRFIIVKKAERKQSSLLANLGDLNRPLRVRPVRYLGREWWAIDAEDIWAGMVMDLRRLGFESVAMEENVLVREGSPMYEPQMEGPNAMSGLKPFPTIHPTIQIRRESYLTNYSYMDLNDTDDADEDYEEEDEWTPEDLDARDE